MSGIGLHSMLESWQLWVICLATAVGVIVLGLLAVQRRNKQFLYLRLLLLWLALSSLALLALQPTYTVRTSPQHALMLTDNYDHRVVDSLLESRAYPIFALGSQQKDAVFVPDISSLTREYPEVDTLTIIGDGLPVADEEHVQDMHFNLLLNPLPEGIIALTHTQYLNVRDSLAVTGQYMHRQQGSVSLYLKGPTGIVDSIQLGAQGISRFKLAGVVDLPGKYIFELKVIGAQEIMNERLPVVVEAQEPLDVLLLGSSPGFETNYLKAWLARDQHRVSVRNKISKGIFKYEYLNQEAYTLQRINEKVLARLDLVIADQQALEELTAAEQNFLRSAIENGLGLLMLIDEVPGQLPAYLLPSNINLSKDGQASFALEVGKQVVNIGKWPYTIDDDPFLLTILEAPRGKVVAGKVTGKGMVGISVIEQTYPLLLQGMDAVYTRIWLSIVEQLVRKDLAPRWKIPHSELPFPDQPLQVSHYAVNDTPLGILQEPSGDSTLFYLIQDSFIPSYWQGKIWPRDSGWHQIYSSGMRNDSLPFFVLGSGDRIGVKRNQKIQKNNLLQQKLRVRKYKIRQKQQTHQKPIQLWWIFCIFIISVGGLWLENKIPH